MISQNGQNEQFYQNLNCQGHISTFSAKNKTKKSLFKTGNHSLTLPEEHQYFFKVQKLLWDPNHAQK